MSGGRASNPKYRIIITFKEPNTPPELNDKQARGDDKLFTEYMRYRSCFIDLQDSAFISATYNTYYPRPINCIIEEYCIPKRPAVAEMEEFMFAQDDASARYSHLVRSFVTEQFPDRWIGHHAPIEWNAHAPAVTPFNLFLWVYFMSIVYATKPRAN